MVASEVHYPGSVAEVLDLLEAYPGLLLYAGGTEILRERGGRFVELPPVVALLDSVAELRAVNLTERYIDIGASLTLTEVLEIREGALPAPLVQVLRGIATPSIRDLATVGGHLATKGRFMDAWSVLSCLDALVELRDNAGIRWVNVNRLADESGRPSFPAGALLTRLRVPLDAWDRTVLAKIGNRNWPSRDTALFCLLARVEQGSLASFRLAMAGPVAFRFPELESRLIGARLPLHPADIADLAQDWGKAAAERSSDLAPRLAGLVATALEGLDP